MYLKNAEKSSIDKIRKYLINTNISDKYLLEDQFVSYLKKYNSKNNFEDNSFIYEENGKKIYCPNTIEKKDNKKYLNYLGNPIKFFFQNEINDQYKNNFLQSLYNLLKKKNIQEISLCLEIEKNNYEYYLSRSESIIETIYQDAIINLNLSEEEIFKNISKGHKSELKKNKNRLTYRIINYKNYPPNLILQMMKLHKFLAGKQTRSIDSWLENEKMIIQKKGFLVCAIFNQQIISYSFFFHNDLTGIYFSSCTEREYFKYAGITHNSIWHAIKYLKNIGCRYFYIGKVKTLYSKNPLTTKEKNVERFKKSFGGINRNFIIYNNIPSKI